MTAAAVRIESLTKHYGSARGIADLDLAVGRGEVFGFLGPNGAGKTTTIRILMDHIRPSSGHAEILGLDTQRDAIEVRRRVGFLASDVALYPKMTGREVLTYLQNLRRTDDDGALDELVERFEVQLDRPIRELSMGNRQKVAVVAAFLHRPELLILDEPTTGLDPLVQQELHALLGEVRAEGRTVFLSSHTLSEVERVADRVAIIREGRLVVTERVEELKRKAIRRLELEFAHPVPAEQFEQLPDVNSATADGNVVHVAIAGPVGQAITLAARHELLNVVSAEPDLEELFLTYYRRKPGVRG